MALGIVGLPIPDETILTFAGYLVSKNDLQLIPAIISSFLGTTSGISISFLLGRTYGQKFIRKFGDFFHITQNNQERIKKWFDGFGSWVILFGYFIPGVRHITALTAGSMKVSYIKFAAFAYTGGFLWTITFILFGYFVGKKWMLIIDKIHNHLIVFTFIIIIVLIIYLLIRNKILANKNKNLVK